MAKRKASKKQNKAKRRSAGISFEGAVPKFILIIFFFLVITAGAVFGVKYYFLNSPSFNVKKIAINKDKGYTFSAGERKLKRLYSGKNIFTVDLEQVKMIIKNDFPQLRKVEVTRRLPDTLEVDIVSREPVAYIASAGGVVLDAEGVVLSVGNVPSGLVKIKGISFFITRPSTGEKVGNKTLSTALVLLEGLKRKIRLRKGDLDYIDISDKNNIVISIQDVQVKMGIKDFSRKIDDLREIMRDPQINMRDIKYIDLRFDSPVISPR